MKNSSKNRKLRSWIPLLLLNLFVSFNSTAQHSWLWESFASSNRFSAFWEIKTDRIGNSYVTGEFHSDTSFIGSGTLTGNSGVVNASIAKFSSNGNMLWSNSIKSVIGGPYNRIWTTSIDADSSGNCFITGYFVGPISFDANTTINDSAMFIAKYDSSGSFSWAKKIGNKYDRTHSIVLDNVGNIFITGIAIDTTIFDTDTLFQTAGFIAKYTPNGNLDWLLPLISTNSARGISIYLDKANNILVTGLFSDTLKIGSQILICIDQNLSDIFVSKLDHSGNIKWLKSIAGINNDQGYGITSDQLGNVFVTGQFSDSVNFNHQLFTSNNNTFDIFVAKYDSSGNELWFRPCGGSMAFDEGHSITTDILGNCIVRGTYEGNCTFGSTTINSNGNTGYFISIYNSGGYLLELHTYTISSHTANVYSHIPKKYGVSCDQYGNIYTAGILDTGLTVLDNDTIYNNSTLPQAIVMKLGCQSIPSTINFNGTFLVSTNAINYQWFFNGLPVNGANSQTLTPFAEGDYQVLITDSSGCRSTSNIYSYIETDIINASKETVQFIYPNPAQDKIRVAQSNSYHHLQIFDVTGKELLSTREYVIDLSSFSEGFYLYKIWQDNGNCIGGKFVVSR